MELKKILQGLKVLAVVGVLSTIMVQPALADWQMGPQPPGVPGDFATAVSNATNWLLGFVAMIAVLVIVWGGINYIGSAGNEDSARTAKRTITYGIIGVVIAGFAYAIVKVIVMTILT